jgi:hypothetical protein
MHDGLRSYLKYYWLEQEYLEKEVYPHFHKHGLLNDEQFFAIIRWKSPGLGSVPIRDGLLKMGTSLEKAVRDLAEAIAKARSKEERLEILLEQDGIQLAMASAVLTILYPDEFSVYDWRVRSQLKHPKRKGRPFPDISYSRDRIRRYFEEYIPQVKATAPSLSLRDCDRILWARSWHDGLLDFIKS